MAGLNPNMDGAASENVFYWNYTKPQNEDYSIEIMGTVCCLQEVQKTVYGTKQPDFWPDGNPKMNIRIGLVTSDGRVGLFTFSPAGREACAGKKKSIHIDLFKLSGGKDIKELIGKTIRITTQEPPQGFSYGSGNPRPFNVELVSDDSMYIPNSDLPSYLKVDKVFANNGAHGGQVVQQQQQPAPRPVPVQQPVPQQQFAQRPMPPQYQQQQFAAQPPAVNQQVVNQEPVYMNGIPMYPVEGYDGNQVDPNIGW